MGRYRLSEPAKADIASVLRTSETMYGIEARMRYRALLTAAMRRIAAPPVKRPANPPLANPIIIPGASTP